MSLFEELERLNEGLTPEDLLKLDEKRGIAEQTARWERINSGQPSHSGELAGGPRMSGKGSWYSQLPQHGWVDREDKPGSNALGVPDDEQGIALPSRKTLGQWFDVTFPNGETHRLQQTDVGPAQWTGKSIDISAAAAHKAGFTPKDFPNGKDFTWSPAEGPPGPQTYDTEDRTAAGIGLTRNQDEAATFDPTGRKRMANGDQQGILGALGMQNQQPQGLLGALGDPETMAYIGMMLKGFSPYSNLDPNSMLSNAHTLAMRKQALMQQQAENAIDNARADKALGLREREFGDARTEREAREADRLRLKQEALDQATAQRKADAGFYDPARPDTTDPAAPLDPTAPSPPSPLTKEQEIEKIDQYLAQKSGEMSPAGIARLEKRKAALEKGPSASTQKLMKDTENELNPMLATRDKLLKMQELLPNVLEGPMAGLAGNIGGRAGPLGSQAAKDTLQFNNLADIETVRDMSRTMKGSTAVKEMEVWLSKASDPTLPKQVRQDNLNMAITAINREVESRQGRIQQLQEGTYGRKPSGGSAPRTEGGGQKRLRFNPETGNFE